MVSGIYIIRNTINKKVYIGSAVNIKRRLCEHKRDLLKNKHGNIHLQRFVNKYGIETISFEILELVLNKKNLIEREQSYIDSYKFSNLFNILKTAGSPLGRKLSEDTKKKIGKGNKGNKTWLGKKLSEEHKKKIGKGNKGKTLGRKALEATKKKMSENQTGKKHSEATKKKIGKGNKGKKLSEVTKKKLSEFNKDKKHSEATKIKMRGRKLSEATKNKTRKTVLIFKDGILIDTILGVIKIAKKYNLDPSSISRVCLGKQKTTGGYTMKYA